MTYLGVHERSNHCNDWNVRGTPTQKEETQSNHGAGLVVSYQKNKKKWKKNYIT